jgi:hypothetical protein
MTWRRWSCTGWQRSSAMLRLGEADRSALSRLLAKFGIDLRLSEPGAQIPGSYWGESEAGLQGSTLLARLDTPLHSIFHEAAHFICMSPERRVGLDRDAGGDEAEESAVCYLQVLLAERLRGTDRASAWRDMDEWGYTFRLGSAQTWFEQDAHDARAWLQNAGIIDSSGDLTGRVRAA